MLKKKQKIGEQKSKKKVKKYLHIKSNLYVQILILLTPIKFIIKNKRNSYEIYL